MRMPRRKNRLEGLGTRLHSHTVLIELLEVELEELLQDGLLRRECGEECVMLEEETDEETETKRSKEDEEQAREESWMNSDHYS